MSFHAQDVARAIARAIKQPMDLIKAKDADLADQIKRATMSVVLNIAEGSKKSGRDKTNRYRIAAGSAAEVRAAVELAVDWSYVGEESVAEVLALLDREMALLFRLEFPRKTR